MLEKIICFLQGKIAPLGLILSLIVTIILTATEVKFYNLGNQEEIVLYPNEVRSFPIGLAIMIPSGYEGQIRSRAGMAGKGIIVANAPATIDGDHNGEIKVMLLNVTDKPLKILPGQKVAQMVFGPVVQAVFIEEEN